MELIMEIITRRLKIGTVPEIAFKKFVNEFNEWWPKEYTWSQDKLKEIKIDKRKDGLCTEIGPNGFRCDWGTVKKYTDNEKISLKWQISPNREPIPNPDKASDLNVDFYRDGNSTTIKFEHFNFDNHGKGSEDYRKMMDSDFGWDYILKKYKEYCEKEHV
jgi:hypothetical protein